MVTPIPNKNSRRTWLLSAAAASLAGWGCSHDTKPPPQGPSFIFVIRSEDDLADAHFQVDVLAANSTDRSRFEDVSVKDYFEPDSEKRPRNALVRTTLTPNRREVRLDLATAANGRCRYPGYTHVVILADIPISVRARQDDPRKLILPLDPKQWSEKGFGTKWLVTVRISRQGVSADPGPLGSI